MATQHAFIDGAAFQFRLNTAEKPLCDLRSCSRFLCVSVQQLGLAIPHHVQQKQL